MIDEEVFLIYKAEVRYDDLVLDEVTYKFGKSFNVSCEVKGTWKVEINPTVEGERENETLYAEMTPPDVEHGRCTGKAIQTNLTLLFINIQ